jgi:hypothetical protein
VESNARTGKKVITIKGNVQPAQEQTSTTPVKPQNTISRTKPLIWFFFTTFAPPVGAFLFSKI